MSVCIPGREVVIRVRDRRTRVAREASVVCPVKWTKGRLLAYCRREHKDATVVIVEWKSSVMESEPWRTRLWIVSPSEMA